MFDINEELKKLPDSPGVYLMKNEKNEIIYVGKAISLKNRVRQYFQSSRNHSIKVKKMVENIVSFEYIITSSEVEALVLECNLIKKYTPKYNIRLKDDKNYPYIKIDIQNAFPRVKVVRQMKKDQSKYFGPYTDVQAMWELVDIIKKIWKLRTCNRDLPKDINKERPCLNYHIGQCTAPCAGNISSEEYHAMIEDVISFLNGKYKTILKKLEEEMHRASEAFLFEKAATIRDQIKAIQKLEQKQSAINHSMEDQDVIAYAKNDLDTLMQVYFVRAGKLVGREHFYLQNTQEEETEHIFRNFIMQFYADAVFIPKEIIIEKAPEDIKVLEEFLSLKKGSKVTLKLPQKGVKYNLLELASKNASLTLNQFGEQLKKEQQKTLGALKEIREALGIQNSLHRIEAYDISNTQGIQSVGGMVVFEDGKPKRSDYRKFKIKSVVGPNDYGSIEEVIERRILRLQKEQGETSFAKMPDVIFIDGGKGQISSVKKVMEKYSIDIPVCGMVKDDRHRTRGLMFEGKEVLLPIGTEGFKLITRIQDEVHRFSIDFHRKLRGKTQVQSILDDIKGVGTKRKQILIKHFKGIDQIKAASLEDLEQIEGISKDVAANIYNFFHENK
jgi:excinuclease ABC subunit C